MKKKIKIYQFCIVFLFVNMSYSQIEKYDVKFIYDTEIILENGDVLIEKMQLLYSPQKSVYVSPVKLILDSLKIEFRKQGDIYGYLEAKAKYPENRLQYVVFKEHKSYKYQLVGVDKTNIEINNETPQLEWQLQQKYDSILNYKTQLATAIYNNTEYEAWFTADIPINNGPYFYQGLPGLIVKIKNKKLNYNIQLVGIENKKGIMPEPLTEKIATIKFSQLYTTILGSHRSLIKWAGVDNESEKKIIEAGENKVEKKYLFEF